MRTAAANPQTTGAAEPSHNPSCASGQCEARLKNRRASVHGSEETRREIDPGFERRWMLHERDVKRRSEKHATTEAR